MFLYDSEKFSGERSTGKESQLEVRTKTRPDRNSPLSILETLSKKSSSFCPLDSDSCKLKNAGEEGNGRAGFTRAEFQKDGIRYGERPLA
jgi:hypothetical protein